MSGIGPVRARNAAAHSLADVPLVQAGLDCGNPLAVADLRPDDTVLDLGSGGGPRINVMSSAHADQVLAIYQAGLDSGNASFETTAPSWEEWDRAHLAAHRFVATDADGSVLGWVAATPVSSRCVYAGVLEHSVYVRPDRQGRGVGAALLDAFIAATEAAGVWTLQSGIFPENAASLALHQRVGFRVVGTRERIGRHHGLWRDVVLIERRSSTADRSGLVPGRGSHVENPA
jgi:phosphinothricin acetyltransferase